MVEIYNMHQEVDECGEQKLESESTFNKLCVKH